MGLFDFVKGAGERLFGKDETPQQAAQADPATPQYDPVFVAAQLTRKVEKLELPIEGLEIDFEVIVDREALGLAPPEAAVKGVYKLLEANGTPDVTLVYQGSDVAYAFVSGVLPMLREKGINADVYYVSSVELFDRLPAEEREAIFPASAAASAMMFSGFTVGTTWRWITSERGREFTHYPWKHGEFLGSGPGDVCLEQAGMHGAAQWKIIEQFIGGSRHLKAV